MLIDTQVFPLNEELFTLNTFERYLASLKKKNGEQPEPATLASHRSALNYLYTRYKSSMPQAFKDDLAVYFKGINRMSARRKQAGIGKVEVGKRPVGWGLFRLLCKTLLQLGSSDSIFAHTIITTSWNLICRAGNATHVHYSHMDWRGDALGIFFAHQKNDQEGKKPKDPRHLYANPQNPEVCVITSLGIFWLVFGFSRSGKLFDGAKQYDRYLKAVKRLLEQEAVKEELRRLGVDPDLLGTHSSRKGVAPNCYVLTPFFILFTCLMSAAC